jgi:hypothetical protein
VTSSALVYASFSLSALVGQLSGSLVVSDTTQATVAPALDGEEDRLAWDIENLPAADLRLSWPESSFSIGYGPRFFVRDAFEDEDLLIIHTVRVTYAYTSSPSRIALELIGNFGREALTVPPLLPPEPLMTPVTPADSGPDPTAPVPAAPGAVPGAVPGATPGAGPGAAPGAGPGVPAAPTAPPPEPLRIERPNSALSAGLLYAYGAARWDFSLQQSVGLSEQSLAALSLRAPITELGSAPTPIEAPNTPEADLVSPGKVRTFTETTGAGLGYLINRRLRSQFQLSYTISGGFGDDRAEGTAADEGRLTLPQQRTAAGGASLTHQLTRNDDLTTSVGLTQTEVSTGGDFWTLGVSQGWGRRWTPNVSSTVSVGVSGTSAGREDSDERDESVEPTLAASLFATLYARGQTNLGATIGTTVSPSVNALTGELQTRLSSFAGLALVVDTTTVNAEASLGQTLPPDDAGSARVVGLGVGMSERVFEFMSFGAQYRTIWQNLGDDGAGVSGATDAQDRLWSASFTLGLVGPAIDF